MRAIAGLALAGVVVSAPAQTLEDNARKVYAEYGGSVVSISAVLRIDAPGAPRGPQERAINVSGTVVGPNGLTVVSATTLSPLSGMTEALEMSGVRPTTSVSQIKIRLANGTEVSARQVLTDEELDLTFLAPESDAGRPATMPRPVIFARGVEAKLFETLIALAGTGELFDWRPVVGPAQVNGIVDAPRRMYLISRSFSNAPGTPVFLADGRPLGLTVVRREAASARAGRGPQIQQAIVLLPADDLAELVERAQKIAETPK
jgi:hypothetical protein